MGKYTGQWKDRQDRLEAEARSKAARKAAKAGMEQITPEARRARAQKAAAARWAKRDAEKAGGDA